MTLLETMLVLTIASGIMLIGFRMVDQVNNEGQFHQIDANLSALFEGMSNYYKFNCYGSADNGSGTPTNIGSLNPQGTISTPKVLNVQTDLVTAGFLGTPTDTTQQHHLPIVPLIDYSGSVGPAYVLQFNEKAAITPVQVNACVVLANETGACSPSLPASDLPNNTTNKSQIILWKAQVAILFKSQALASAYQYKLGATCTSTIHGSSVSPCSANVPGPYLVWERLPSFTTYNSLPTTWLSMPRLKQFKTLYTHDENYELQNSNAGQQYYLCGG